jgi:hypothetical protein
MSKVTIVYYGFVIPKNKCVEKNPFKPIIIVIEPHSEHNFDTNSTKVNKFREAVGKAPPGFFKFVLFSKK